jgi:hypothetical protein
MPLVTNKCQGTSEHQPTKETIDRNIDEQFYNSSASCHVCPTSMHKTKVPIHPTTMHNNFAQKQNIDNALTKTRTMT